ncbi:hypothetical protein HAX54_048352 [Datura stramonium]|uniref:Uncharacterized protein n=1 Tax=Datura stramonium TaxID=4076 RepID=A0ABS8WN18_DATST|nr:hypothetical protein [Datura stramonium]
MVVQSHNLDPIFPLLCIFPSISLNSFVILQAFDTLLRKLQKYVPQGASVVDLYAGAGVIGLSLAFSRKCRSVKCVEVNKESRQSFEKTVGWLPTNEPTSWLLGSDVVVVDPPRKGLDLSLVKELRHVSAMELRTSKFFSFPLSLVHGSEKSLLNTAICVPSTSMWKYYSMKTLREENGNTRCLEPVIAETVKEEESTTKKNEILAGVKRLLVISIMFVGHLGELSLFGASMATSFAAVWYQHCIRVSNELGAGRPQAACLAVHCSILGLQKAFLLQWFDFGS